METFTRPRLTRSEYFDLQCKDRLTKAERILLARAEIVDDAPAPADENAASLATLDALLAGIAASNERRGAK